MNDPMSASHSSLVDDLTLHTGTLHDTLRALQSRGSSSKSSAALTSSTTHDFERHRTTDLPSTSTSTLLSTPSNTTSKPDLQPARSTPQRNTSYMHEDTASSRHATRPVMTRGLSSESHVSSVSSNTPGNADSADITGLVAAAGSVEAALLKLVKDKQSADSHNAQLWRILEKQRAMILGLNKDLERAVKDKDRYRKKLKEVTQTFSAGTASIHRSDSALEREGSQSPAPSNSTIEPARPSPRHGDSSATDPVSQSSHATQTAEIKSARSRTPFESIHTPEPRGNSASVVPSPITSMGRHGTPSRESSRTPASASGSPSIPQSGSTQDMHKLVRSAQNVLLRSPKSPPLSPPFTPPATVPASAPTDAPRMTLQEATPMPDAGNFSPQGSAFGGPRTSKMQRKGAPAPLNLVRPAPAAPAPPSEAPQQENERSPSVTVVQENPELSDRGRRRTRADDDRVRDAYAAAQEEARSLSKKSRSSKSKSKSKSKGPHEQPQIVEPADQSIQILVGLPPSPRATKPPPNMASFLSPANSESSSSSLAVHRSNFASPLLSPGLPMSPRPMDRPTGAPSPRLPKQMMLPNDTQDLLRGERFSEMVHSAVPAPLFAKSIVKQDPVESPLNIAHDNGAADALIEHRAQSPASPLPTNIYRGLISDQYPSVLLPPNALPSIDVKVFSSRLRPSRHSLLLGNPSDEDPVILLGIYARSSGQQLWRLEKTIFAFSELHQQLNSSAQFRGKLPERALFSGHAPAKIDARRAALNAYFDLLLDTPLTETAALIVCGFFSTNVMDAEQDRSPITSAAPASGSSISHRQPEGAIKEGYLTKRGKNFGGWKARYFVLDGPELKYFDSQTGPQIGVIKLLKAKIGKQSQQSVQENDGKEEEADNQYRHAFLLLEPKKKDSSSLVRHVLCAESDEERDAWVAALLQHVSITEKEAQEPEGAQPAPSKTSKSIGASDSVSSTARPKRKTQTSSERSLVGSEKAAQISGRQAETSSSNPQGSVIQGVSYEDTVAGDMPIQGTTVSKYSGTRGLTSPQLNGSFTGMPGNVSATKSTISISGPSNGAVIQNAGTWGMKTPIKEKKRSIFGFHKARTPSDTTSGQSSTNSSVMGNERRPPLTRPIFGMPLAEAVEMSQPAGMDVQLPAVVYRCIEYLEAKGASKEEGIFRLSGSQNAIKALRERFNNEGDVKLLDGSYYDVHAVASLLKLYLRELPSSILTRDLHLDFLKCLEAEDKEQRIPALNMLVHMLPRANLELLSNLCSYLADIANACDINKMNVRNVAIVFAPTLNIPAPLIQLFLTDYTSIFVDDLDDLAQQHSSPIRETEVSAPQSDAIRSPRHQMFSDLPTPAYHQNSFPQQGVPGFQPLVAGQATASISDSGRPTYAQQRSLSHEHASAMNGFPTPPAYQTSGVAEGNYMSLNAPSTQNLAVPPGINKKSRRESSMLGMDYGLINQRQSSRSTLRDTSSSRIPEDHRTTSQTLLAQHQRARELTPERSF